MDKPRVKPLEWSDAGTWGNQPAFYADSSMGWIMIVDHRQHGNGFRVYPPWEEAAAEKHSSLEAAKAAAQADYEARILAAFEPAPVNSDYLTVLSDKQFEDFARAVDQSEQKAPVSVQEHARALLDAESDGEVWRTYVNAMMPILREDMSADSWHTVDEIRSAMTAALRALAGDEVER